MLVFWEKKLVLLATPKTGTTALEGALSPLASVILRDPPILKHVPHFRFRNKVMPLLKTAGGDVFETIAVVREPISWFGSWYRYRCRDALIGQPNSARGVSFNDFLREVLSDTPAPYADLGRQANFVRGKDTPVGVTHLFRYEAMDVLVKFFEERLELESPLKLRTLNVSPELDLDIDPEVEEQLRDQCAEEFAIWEGARHA